MPKTLLLEWTNFLIVIANKAPIFPFLSSAKDGR